MKSFLLLFFILLLSNANAQGVRTDTVKPGYYIPLNSNVVSCKVVITPKGNKAEVTNTTSNRLPDTLIGKIGGLGTGSVVVYDEITILSNGILEKSPSVRYVIGQRNSVFALRDPSLPDTLPAAEIASLVLDPHVYSFHISFVQDGGMYDYDLTGNGVFGDAKDRILTLPSGTRVWFENIKRKEDDGNVRVAPPKIYVVK